MPNPALEAETIRRMANEEVRIAVSPSEVEALRSLLNPLLDEISRIAPSDREGAEPEVGITVEEWPR